MKMNDVVWSTMLATIIKVVFIAKSHHWNVNCDFVTNFKKRERENYGRNR